MPAIVWQILNMKHMQWSETGNIIKYAETCLKKLVKSHQLNLLLADF